MSLSPGVWGRSRWDEAVFASDQDREQLDEIIDLLVRFGRQRERMLNDARHIQNAVRYAADSFVTRDRFLLNQDAEIRERFRLRIVTPEQAAHTVRRRANRAGNRTDE